MKSLLERVAAGEAAGVQECIDRYGGLVWSLARRMSANLADAEDAVQEIFVELWRKAPRFDPRIASEATFVAMIARRRLIDLRRKLARHGEASELPEALAAPREDHAERAEIGDDAARARRALAELKPEQQRVLRLAVFDGLSHPQIASVTGLPLGTVKTHARRGLLRIRELLTHERAHPASEVKP